MKEEQNFKWIPIIAVGAIVIIATITIFMFVSKKDPALEVKIETTSIATESDAAQASTTINTKVASMKIATTSTDLMQIINKDSILRSTDSGDSFSPFFKISANEQVGLANVLSITFHPLTRDKIIVTSLEDGLFNKEAEKDMWDIISFPPKKIYSFILDKKNPDDRMFASGVVNENGRIFRTEDGGQNWKAVYVEPGNASIITALAQDPRDVNIIYSGTSQGTIVKSSDGGNTWKNIGNRINGVIKYLSFDATRSSVIYLLSFQKKMYYSPDKGATWLDWEEEKVKEIAALTKQAAELAKQGNKQGAENLKKQAEALKKRNTTNKMPSAINLIVADPKVSGTIYAGTKSGLFRSTDFGKYWTELDIIESAKSYPIRSIAVNPKNSKEVIFVAGNAFYKTQNSGGTWSITPLSSDRTASFVAYDPFDVNTIFVGVSSI